MVKVKPAPPAEALHPVFHRRGPGHCHNVAFYVVNPGVVGSTLQAGQIRLLNGQPPYVGQEAICGVCANPITGEIIRNGHATYEV